jgi:phage portal protein BeeE
MGLYSRLKAAARAAMKNPPSQAQTSVSIVFQNASRGGMFGSEVKFKDAVENAYRGLIWVYRCAKAVGESVGAPPWKVYQKGKTPDELKPIPDHPLEKLLSAPNPYMSGSEFFEAWAIYMQLAGECYWEIVPVQKKPYHLYPIRPDWMTPTPDPINFV